MTLCRGTIKLHTNTHAPTTIATGSFTTAPGYVHPVTLTITGKLLTTLQHRHRLHATISINAHDGAKPIRRKTTVTKITLVYQTAA
jgi:hypothetical protein